jgi:phage gp36-like protein
MGYCTLDDLRRSVGSAITLRYFDDDNDGVEDAVSVSSVLSHVDAIIDGKLSRLYTVATLRADPPALLRTIAVDMALARMGQRRPDFQDSNGRPMYHAIGRQALDTLVEIQKGETRLDIDDVPAKPANVKGQGVYTASSSTDDTAPAVTDGFIRNGSGDF